MLACLVTAFNERLYYTDGSGFGKIYVMNIKSGTDRHVFSCESER